jgi:RecB family endonuclease NucS
MAKNVSVTIPIEEIQVKNNDSLENLVTKEIEKVEDGLTIIGRQIPVNHDKIVDLLCVDRNGQIVVFKLNVKEDDNMLFEGLTTFHEVNCVKQMLKFFNKSSKINDKELPRLILLAPNFSNNVMNIAKNMDSVKINLYQWEYLKFGDKKSLRFKPVSLA